MAIQYYDSLGNQVTRMYQWDINQFLTVKGVATSPLPIFQFANRESERSINVTPTVSGTSLIVAIPNELLEEAEPIFAYIYRPQATGAGRTIGSVYIPVIPRVKPEASASIEE